MCSVAQSCLTLCDPMDCSLPGSSVHVIFQARILEWVAMPSFRGSSYLRDQTRVSPELAGRFFTTITTWKALDLAKCGGGSAKSPAHPTPTLRSTKGWCLAGELSRRLLELPGERLKHPHSWIQLCSTAQTAMISPPAP